MKDPIVSNASAVDIVDVTIDNFMSEVIEVSNSKAVIVQFLSLIHISEPRDRQKSRMPSSA